MLSPRALTVPGIGGTWCAVRVKPRNEKSLAADMLNRGFDYFLPLVKSLDSRKRVSYSPPTFLRGLIFASSQDKPSDGFHVPTDLHYFLNDHHAVFGLITVCQAAQAKFQTELDWLYGRIVRSEINSDTGNSNFTPIIDQVCEIRDGAFRGQTVKVTRILPNNKVEVVGTLVGGSSTMRIEASRLEPTG